MTKARVNQQRLERAKEMHRKFTNLRVSFRAHWAIYGKLALEFEHDELFKLLGHGSMKSYLKSLPDVCYSTIAEAMAVQRAFPAMKVEELSQYPKENLKILAKLPESKRTGKQMLDAARTMKSKDLRVMVNKKHSTHLEAKQRVSFDVETTVVRVIEDAIRKAIDDAKEEDGEDITRGEAVERIFVTYLQN